MELYTRTDKDPNVEVTVFAYEAHGITIDSEFKFDGASAPRIFWSIIPPFKRTKKAACMHDWNCRRATNAEERKEADLLFRVMLLEAGISKLRAEIGYAGVRLGAHLGIGIYY